MNEATYDHIVDGFALDSNYCLNQSYTRSSTKSKLYQGFLSKMKNYKYF